jgi:hypothetical protein
MKNENILSLQNRKNRLLSSQNLKTTVLKGFSDETIVGLNDSFLSLKSYFI